jgi:pyrroline-5-carboxylate reductase
MEEMIKAAVAIGLDEELAKKLVIQTAKGAAILADTSEDSPAELRVKVTSPGGTTEAALNTLADGNISGLITEAIKNAAERSRELSK